jgi:hypothetical protein
VDELTAKAIDAGGKRAMDPVDLGFLYGASFYDLDGHHWEVVWIAPPAMRVYLKADDLTTERIH